MAAEVLAWNTAQYMYRRYLRDLQSFSNQRQPSPLVLLFVDIALEFSAGKFVRLAAQHGCAPVKPWQSPAQSQQKVYIVLGHFLDNPACLRAGGPP